MYTKQQFIDSVSHDFAIIIHLAEKIPADTLGYKPSENQRTTLELLQYLSVMFATTAEAIRTGDMSLYAVATEVSKKTTVENFADMMRAQEARFKESIEKYTDADFDAMIGLFGSPEKPKSVYLIESIMKWLAAYKMQLFLYIKASGNSSIGTSNVWGGFDMQPK